MSGTQPNASRKRPMVTITLSPEELRRLDDMAARWGISRSAAIGRLVRETQKPRRV